MLIFWWVWEAYFKDFYHSNLCISRRDPNEVSMLFNSVFYLVASKFEIQDTVSGMRDMLGTVYRERTELNQQSDLIQWLSCHWRMISDRQQVWLRHPADGFRLTSQLLAESISEAWTVPLLEQPPHSLVASSAPNAAGLHQRSHQTTDWSLERKEWLPHSTNQSKIQSHPNSNPRPH